ncbi:MAG: type II secretion system F family protein [Tissierellaceae bacterium]|nr:type II secretion system F family protein [Tissierellaceae bacterium]
MIYKYKAITKNGEPIEGFFEASNESDVLTMLKGNNYLPVSVERDVGADAQVSLFPTKVKKKDLAVFCRQFYTMVDAGIGIVKCFDILEAQTRNKTLKKAIGAIYEDVQKGFTISEAMKKHTKIFPTILINMIEAGEVSGTLDSILERMANHFEQENKLENKIKSSLIYPISLIVVSIAVVIFMLVAVLPTFVGMFEGSGVALPWPTQFVLDLSSWLQKYWYIFLGVVIIIVGGFLYFRSTVEGRKFIDGLKIKIPGIRVTNAKIITSRFTRTLSTLMASGIPLLQALEVVGKVLNNTVVQARLMDSMDGIRRGASLSRAVKAMEIFPPMVDSMISIGEESGALDDILAKTADFYDDEVEMSLQRMTTLIEPILLVGMAVVIGFIVIAMAMPMFDMVNTI